MPTKRNDLKTKRCKICSGAIAGEMLFIAALGRGDESLANPITWKSSQNF